MYMFRAYQSPYSGADCGPQCAQIPNLASRNHSGTRYVWSDSRVAWNGPGAMLGALWAWTKLRAAAAPAVIRKASRLVIFIWVAILYRKSLTVTISGRPQDTSAAISCQWA